MAATVAKVAGLNARKIRGKASLSDVATAAKDYGLPWTSGRVGDFEAGRTSPTLTTLFAAAAALGDVTGRPVALTDLFAGTGNVEINDNGLSVPLADVRAALSGQPVSVPARAKAKVKNSRAASATDDARPLPDWARGHTGLQPRGVGLWLRFREADQRVCAQLGLDPIHGAMAMALLWGQLFSEERDVRAGADANAQQLGQVSRQLKVELSNLLHGKEIR